MAAVELHTDVRGPEGAPVVVLLGSLGSDLSMWDPQVPALVGEFRVVRCDARGHGRSPVPAGPYVLDDLVDDVLRVVDGLGAERASYVGLSLGGMTAMRLAVRAPERVDRLALLCTAAVLPGAGYEERATRVRAEGTGWLAETVVNRWLTPAGAAAEPELADRLRAMVASTPPEGYAGCCEAIGAMDLVDALPSITAPTLVIGGEDDPATPPEHQRLIASAVPGARLLLLSPAAHLANLEQADAVNAALLDHLRRSTGTRTPVRGLPRGGRRCPDSR